MHSLKIDTKKEYGFGALKKVHFSSNIAPIRICSAKRSVPKLGILSTVLPVATHITFGMQNIDISEFEMVLFDQLTCVSEGTDLNTGVIRWWKLE